MYIYIETMLHCIHTSQQLSNKKESNRYGKEQTYW